MEPEMLNLSRGAVTVKRKLSVRETAEVIRKSHLKKKIRAWLSSYVTNPKIRNGAQIATKETWGLKMWSIQKDNNSDPLWSSHHTCRLQMRFPTISFLVWDLDDMSVPYDYTSAIFGDCRHPCDEFWEQKWHGLVVEFFSQAKTFLGRLSSLPMSSFCRHAVIVSFHMMAMNQERLLCTE